MPSISFSISQLIGDAQLKEACGVMKDFFNGKGEAQLLEQLTLLEFRMSHLQHKIVVVQGGSEMSEDSLERNRIVFELIGLNKRIMELEKDQAQQEFNDPEIQNLIYANFYATSEKDLEGVLRTLHPENPQLESQKQLNLMLFQRNDLDLVFEIKPPIRILSYSNELATAEIVQYTWNKKPNVLFRPNQTTQICLFKKYKDRWRLYSGTVKKVEYFDVEFTTETGG